MRSRNKLPSIFRDQCSVLALGSPLMDGRAKNTHMEGKLAREVIHATGMHETEGVAHCFSTQNALACDGTDPTIGKGGCHDTA